MQPVIRAKLYDMTYEARVFRSYWWEGKLAFKRSIFDLYYMLIMSMLVFRDPEEALVVLRQTYAKLPQDGYAFGITVFDKLGTWHWTGGCRAYSIHKSVRYTNDEWKRLVHRTNELAPQCAPLQISSARADFMRQLPCRTKVFRTAYPNTTKTDTLSSFSRAEEFMFALIKHDFGYDIPVFGLSVLAPTTDFMGRRKRAEN